VGLLLWAGISLTRYNAVIRPFSKLASQASLHYPSFSSSQSSLLNKDETKNKG
jgi:hypothetical protein